MSSRVVVSGIGVVAPNGVTTEAFWNNCLEGKAAVAPIPEVWREYATPVSTLYAPLPQLNLETGRISRIERMQMDMAAVIALCAGRQAIDNAGFITRLHDEKRNSYVLEGLDPCRCGIFMGSGIGGIASFSAAQGSHCFTPINELVEKAKTALADSAPKESIVRAQRMMRMPARFNPFSVAMTMPNAAAAALGIKYGIKGQNSTVCNACASGTSAIGLAFRAIRSGCVDAALCGGVEYLGDEYGGIFRAFDAAKTLVRDCAVAETANCPFDKKRSGFLFAEGGGAVLVVESLEHALARNAPLVAEIIGFAESFDAFSMMAMEPGESAIKTMIGQALEDASCSADEIGLINSHGTGTLTNDEIEAAILYDLFPHKPLIEATKSLIGHTIGASGAIEAAVTALGLQRSMAHGCKNLIDPLRELNFVRETQHTNITRALTHSFAFGGHNSGLVLAKI